MAKTDNLGDFLTDIADAIRTKKGTSGTINAQNISSEIASISGGADLSEYFNTDITSSTSSSSNFSQPVIKLPKFTISSNVTSLDHCFSNYGYSSLEFDNSINTDNVTDMQYMFYYCNKITNIDLSKFNTSKVTNMNLMFYYASLIKNLNLKSFKTDNVSNFSQMFSGTTYLSSLDLRTFDINDYAVTSYMFNSAGTSATVANGAYAAGIPYVYVKNEDMQTLVLNTSSVPSTWSTANVVVGDLYDIKIKGTSNMFLSTTETYTIDYIGGTSAQKGITWSCTGNATITDGVLTLTSSAAEGDTIVITATSTYDSSISDTLTVTVHNRTLPSEYQEVEYIKSTGTQWINTGYTHKSNTKIKLSCNADTTSYHNWEALFGARKGSYYYNAFIFFSRTSGNAIPKYNRTNYEYGTASNFIYGEDIIVECYKNKATWTNGTDTYNLTIPASTSLKIDGGNCPMFIFNLNTSNTAGGVQADTSGCGMKLYYFQIQEDDNVVKKFIPCYRVSDNVIGLYDLIGKTFYTNRGSGTFTKGSDV